VTPRNSANRQPPSRRVHPQQTALQPSNPVESVSRIHSGSHEEIRRFALLGAIASGRADQWKAFADQCMAEYDLAGWTVPDLVNPSDVSVLSDKQR
jgi:hypothetical protein